MVWVMSVPRYPLTITRAQSIPSTAAARASRRSGGAHQGDDPAARRSRSERATRGLNTTLHTPMPSWNSVVSVSTGAPSGPVPSSRSRWYATKGPSAAR